MFAFDGHNENRHLSDSEKIEIKIRNDFLAFSEKIKLFKNAGAKDAVEFHRVQIEHALLNAVRDVSLMSYLLMEKTNDFTSHGEQRIAISFCRILLRIPADREVTQSDANEFRRIIDAARKSFCDPTVTEMRRRIREADLSLREFRMPLKFADHDDEINALLKLVDSDWYFFYGTKAKHCAMILGKIHPIQFHGKTPRFSEKPLIVFSEEIMRSPAWLLSNAGSNYKKAYIVRDLSMLTIWHNKWTSFFSSSEEFCRNFMSDSCREYAMREGIKTKAFDAYGIHSKEDLEKHQADFLNDACQGVVWHEYGHCISADNGIFLPQAMARMCRNLSTLDMDAFYPYSEAMADYSPAMEGVYGPLYNICQIAKIDYRRAVAQVYVYISDYYFFERGETYFQEMTFLVLPLMTRFIDAQGKIDFAKLEVEIAPTCATVADATVRWTERVLEMLNRETYNVGGVKLTYTELNNHAINVFRRMYPKYRDETPEEILGYGGHYVNMTNLIKKYNPTFHEKLMEYFKEITEPMIRDVLCRLHPHYDEKTDLRTFCLNELERIGCRYVSPEAGQEADPCAADERESDETEWIEVNEELEAAQARVFRGDVKTGRRLGKRDMEILTDQIREIWEGGERVIVRPEYRYNPLLDYLQHLSPDAARFKRPKTVTLPTPYFDQNRSPQMFVREVNKELLRFAETLPAMPRQSFRGMKINKAYVDRLSVKARARFEAGLRNKRKKIDIEYIERDKLVEIWHDPEPGYYDFQDLLNFREYNQLFGFNMHMGSFSVNAAWLKAWL